MVSKPISQLIAQEAIGMNELKPRYDDLPVAPDHQLAGNTGTHHPSPPAAQATDKNELYISDVSLYDGEFPGEFNPLFQDAQATHCVAHPVDHLVMSEAGDHPAPQEAFQPFASLLSIIHQVLTVTVPVQKTLKPAVLRTQPELIVSDE